jgi:TRAP-type mannitol/chloroaromatic compound transport system permease large subunit
VRLIAWLLVACAALAAIGVFVPCLEVHAGGFAVRRASLSLYRASADRELAHALFVRYEHTGQRRSAEQLANLLLEHSATRAQKLHVDDARDAMTTLDSLDDRQVVIGERALVGVVWGMVALAVLAILVAGRIAVGAAPPRARALVAAVAIALVLAALAVAVHIGCRLAAGEANDEVGADVLVLASGAWMMPLAALGAVVCASGLVVARRFGRAG